MNSIYLILILHGSALWGIPQPFSSIELCEAAGQSWANRGTRSYHCLLTPIATGESVNRSRKTDAYPLLNCWIPSVNAGLVGTPVCAP